jgi:hypothetical protein
VEVVTSRRATILAATSIIEGLDIITTKALHHIRQHRHFFIHLVVFPRLICGFAQVSIAFHVPSLPYYDNAYSLNE